MDGTEKSNQAYRSVGEVASELGVATHVLRYWETKFPKYIAPVKRGVGRRYYRPKDVIGARAVEKLIIQQGLTIKGALQVLGQQSLEVIIGSGESSKSEALNDEAESESKPAETLAVKSSSDLEQIRELLTRLRSIKSRIDEKITGGCSSRIVRDGES